MRKLIFLIIIAGFISVTQTAHAQKNLSGVQFLLTFDRISKLHATLCETDECDIYQALSTTKTCFNAFEKYFKKSDGSLPGCIPNIMVEERIDPFPNNELFCYSNVRLNIHETCDSIYAPTVDVYGVLNESNLSPTPYEICLRNTAAQYDICMIALDMYCWSYCFTLHILPCYDEYDITGDQAALDACLANAQPLEEACKIEKACGGDTYLYPNKTCINECWSQYPMEDTTPCYDEYDTTGDQAALNACLDNAALLFEQCKKDMCGGDRKIYPGITIIK